MRISELTGTLGAAAAIALLAGCSGGSQYAPSATGGSSPTSAMATMHNGAMRIMPLFASKEANDAFNHRPIVNRERGRVIVARNASCPNGLVFASSNVTGDLLEYCGQVGLGSVPAGEGLNQTVIGGAGWGLAVHNNKVAAGVTGGTIAIYHALNLTAPPIILTLAHAGLGYNAYGLSYAPNGGLYATEWPGNYVDYWAPPVSGAPNCVWATTTNTEDYYVNAHGANSAVVYGGSGHATNVDVDTEKVNGMATAGCPAVTDTFIATFGSFVAGTGFPGGIVSHGGAGRLYVNNQYGTLYDDGLYPGVPVPPRSCTWGYNPNDISNISMASNEKSIWASNVVFVPTLSTNIQSFTAQPPPLAGVCTTPGPAGGPMLSIPNDEFIGVAAWPNSGN